MWLTWSCSLSDEETEAQRGHGASPRHGQHSPSGLLSTTAAVQGGVGSSEAGKRGRDTQRGR